MTSMELTPEDSRLLMKPSLEAQHESRWWKVSERADTSVVDDRGTFVATVYHGRAAEVARRWNAHNELIAALAPLAAMAELFDGSHRPPMGNADDSVIYEYHALGGSYLITVGMCRAARKAIAAARADVPVPLQVSERIEAEQREVRR